MEIYEEKIKSDFKGTIIDLETIGNFNKYPDSRAYKDIIPVIFGFINSRKLKILCAKNKDSISLLKKEIKKILPKLKRPFYAFNCGFERGSLFHFIGKPTDFEFELNKEKFEKKERVIEFLGSPKYDDPFNENGLKCKEAWLNGNIKDAMNHNRSCLLKERDILKIRGFRKPDKLEFKKI